MAFAPKAQIPSRDLRLARVLATLISITLVGLGIWSMATQTYSGHTSKLGGANVFLFSGSAVGAGAIDVTLGLVPLALWFKISRHAAWWASGCMVAFLGSLAAVLYG